ncbi:hypothetical protein RJT34_03562 [Clitoria ternatea]|uniref:Uncharacterized protein n=1 Tax=Clitoria ternatea TaxID=43366 RepID=A0AAN9KJN2_CLITE
MFEIGELVGLAIGSTILLNVIITGPVTGASMNPVRSLGNAITYGEYRGIWIYLLSPTLGAVAGAWVYNTVRYTDKPLTEITKSVSFLKGDNNLLPPRYLSLVEIRKQHIYVSYR